VPSGPIFELTAVGQFTVLHTFTDGSDGGFPNAGLALDSAGNIYGTASSGGAGVGVVFEISSASGFEVLHDFTEVEGGTPDSGPTLDSAGNIYGTAANFGAGEGGILYKLEPGGGFFVLYSFTFGPEGGGPVGGVALDPAGNIYGTTNGGGSANCGAFGCGAVYELDTAGNCTVVHSFAGGATDGGEPEATVVLGSAGNLYGTTLQYGLANGGVVFRVALTPDARRR
jgi:uncharacterized repeat protein (TIGR03803 family)